MALPVTTAAITLRRPPFKVCRNRKNSSAVFRIRIRIDFALLYSRINIGIADPDTNPGARKLNKINLTQPFKMALALT
jgi:hypothetical protein